MGTDEGARHLIRDLQNQILTMRWQLQTLAHSLTMDTCVLERFIILRNVSEAEFDRLNDVLEECDGILKREDPSRRGIDWEAVERQFLEILPERKDLTLWEVMMAFFEGHRWKDVCKVWFVHHRNQEHERAMASKEAG